MRWILSVAVCLVAISSVVGGAQAPDKFTLACTLPFDAISVHRPIDARSEIEGRPKPEDGALEANKEQIARRTTFAPSDRPSP